jgi:hypothetical protein
LFLVTPLYGQENAIAGRIPHMQFFEKGVIWQEFSILMSSIGSLKHPLSGAHNPDISSISKE